jgi:hypothetical protein
MNNGRLINYFVNCIKVIFDCVSLALFVDSYLVEVYVPLAFNLFPVARGCGGYPSEAMFACCRKRIYVKTVLFNPVKTCMLLLILFFMDESNRPVIRVAMINR